MGETTHPPTHGGPWERKVLQCLGPNIDLENDAPKAGRGGGADGSTAPHPTEFRGIPVQPWGRRALGPQGPQGRQEKEGWGSCEGSVPPLMQMMPVDVPLFGIYTHMEYGHLYMYVCLHAFLEWPGMEASSIAALSTHHIDGAHLLFIGDEGIHILVHQLKILWWRST